MISILTPSRSRPILAKRMVDSMLANPGCDVEILFFLNADDPALPEYQKFLNSNQYIIGPNQSTCYSWNLMAEKAKYDILFLVGDDAQIVGDNWGKLIINEFNKIPDKIACVYPRAPSVSKAKSPHFCLHKNWIKALGYYLPPIFYHWYVDTWVAEVTKALGRHKMLEGCEMPIETVKDEVNRNYHNSWLKERDVWVWNHSERYRKNDIDTLANYIKNYKHD